MLPWLDRGFLSGTSGSEKVGKERKMTIAPDELRPEKSNENVSRVKHLLNSDRRMSIRMIADELSIPQTQVFEIVTET